MNITKELAEKLNPEGKKLTMAQWQSLINKHEAKEASRNATETEVGEKPGVCKCGNTSFSNKVIRGSGGIIERTCKECGDIKHV